MIKIKEIGFIDSGGDFVYIGECGVRDDHSVCPDWESDKQFETRYDKIKAYCEETKSIRIGVNDKDLNVEFFFKPNEKQVKALLYLCEFVSNVYVDVGEELNFKKEKSVYGGQCYEMDIFEFKEWVRGKQKL